MPELPEVETIRGGLAEVLPGKQFFRVDVRYGGTIKAPPVATLMAKLPGKTVVGTGRRGKYLLIYLDDCSVMVIHLRMTGQLVYSQGEPNPDKHTHVIIYFQDGSSLAFTDIRKFGTIWWLPTEELNKIKGLAKLGPEPLSTDFHADYLQEGSKNRKCSIKALLLNQEFLAGLGNIYVDEALHRARILPYRRAGSLSSQEMSILHATICEVLLEAIECRGTTMSDYRDSTGDYGGFQERLRVYQCQGKACGHCGEIIRRSVVAGRGTHYCPSCQI